MASLIPTEMSSSSESSLVELPLPYDISSAVSRALRIQSTSSLEENVYQGSRVRSTRSLSYPTGYYDFPAHQASTSGAYKVSQGENYTTPYYCSTGNPYFYSIPNSAALDPHSYFYPQHHYPAIHPAGVQMEVEAWTENAAICNSSSAMLESQANMEQLDQFCKYIDSSGDEELIVEGGETNMLGTAAANYDRYISGGMMQSAMMGSPPPKKQRKTIFPTMSLSSYYEEVEDEWMVELENLTMWKEFHSVGTEMVITKAGRRMFPTLSVRVYGIDPNETYSVKLDILPADNKRYKYLQSEWIPVGRSDKKQIYCEYEHPDSPNSGSYWMDKIVAFKMIKLTNNKNAKSADQVILNSMHKYLPCMKIMCQSDGMSQSFSFPETAFIAVTAYQSTGVTRLKINNNPYARAFRESLPSCSSQKSGGHCRHSSNRTNSSASPTGDRSQPPSTTSSPRHKVQGKQKTPCNSSVSVESGFESDTTNEKRKDSTSLIGPQPAAFNSRQPLALMTYWAEDHSLWNPNIITPDPLMETPTSSFSSITYLEDTSSRATGYEMRTDSDESPKSTLDTMIPKPDINLTIPEVEPAIQVDDDVFF